MKRWLRQRLPTPHSIRANRWLTWMHGLSHRPWLWRLHQEPVARGLAIGLFAGLIPGPFQMLGAALLCLPLRANLPVALFATLYSNPLTIGPIYVVALYLGNWVFQTGHTTTLDLPDYQALGWTNWLPVTWAWLERMGWPFVGGLLLLALILAGLGYVAVKGAWRLRYWLLLRRQQRRRRQRARP